jgi:hypothetical protein
MRKEGGGRGRELAAPIRLDALLRAGARECGKEEEGDA